MLFKGISIFSSGGHFVQQSRTILIILVEGYPRNISAKLFWNQTIGLGGDVIFSFGSHFILRRGTILAILVEGHSGNISMKLFWNWAIGLGDVFSRSFYFKLWRPFCSAEWNHSSNFGRSLSKEHVCEIILKSSHWPRRLFKGFSIFSFGSYFILWRGTILAIW